MLPKHHRLGFSKSKTIFVRVTRPRVTGNSIITASYDTEEKDTVTRRRVTGTKEMIRSILATFCLILNLSKAKI